MRPYAKPVYADHPSARAPRVVALFAFLNLLGNIVIVGTGGAVRLTASGLGCPTWPQCTAGSWVPTAELTFHSLIEFGNRLMSPVLGLLAVGYLLTACFAKPRRADQIRFAWILVGGVLVQAVLGGITVLTGLGAPMVAIHYLCSAVLVAVATAAAYAACGDGSRHALAVPRWMSGIGHLLTAVMTAVLVLGVLTTASGPHSGDDGVVRDSSSWLFTTILHGALGTILLLGTVALLSAAFVVPAPPAYRRALIALAVIVVVQMGVGVFQAMSGIPAVAVVLHMVLAVLSLSALTLVLLTQRTRSATASSSPDSAPC